MMIHDHILVVPVLAENATSRQVMFPRDTTWYNISNGRMIPQNTQGRAIEMK